MKTIFIKILSKLGLKDNLVETYLDIRNYLYRNKKEWVLNTSGVKLRFSTDDAYSWQRFYGFYGTNTPEPGTTKIFSDFINRNSTVLDVGSHLGYFTCLAGSLAKKVYSLEADPKCISYIQDNISLNDLNNVEVHNLAISDNIGKVKIQKLDSPDSGLTINARTDKSFIEINCMSLDQFISQFNIKPDFIKIDIEGAEGLAIKGMSEILKKDIVLLIEIHDKALKKWFNKDYKDIIAVLLEFNFSIMQVNHRSKNYKLEKVDLNTSLERNSMLLCRKIK